MNLAASAYLGQGPAATAEQLRALDVDVAHHFGGGAYIKATTIPAGRFLEQHAHSHDHLSVLVSGTVRLHEGERRRVVSGFQVLLLPANVPHAIESLTDCVWLCVWGSDETDSERIDQAILKG